jgi:hypothetical protein
MNAPLCGCGCGKPVGIATQTRARWGHVKGALNPSGLCKCGCGKPAEIAKANRQAFGHVKGEPTLYARGHTRTSGTASPWQFTGERWYVNGRDGRRYLWYRVVARNELGRELGRGEIVHHINGDCTDDRPENLQVVTPREHYAIHLAQGDLHVFSPEERARIAEAQRNRLTKPCETCGSPVTRPVSCFKARTFCGPECWYKRGEDRERMLRDERAAA